eukprot:scaffold120270_cov24-Phaeocystis_antarctica.AAC.1
MASPTPISARPGMCASPTARARADARRLRAGRPPRPRRPHRPSRFNAPLCATLAPEAPRALAH